MPPYRCTLAAGAAEKILSVVSSSTGWPASARCRVLSTQKCPVMTRPTFVFRKLDERIRPERRYLSFASDRCSFVAERTMRFLSSHVPSFAGVNNISMVVTPYKMRSAMNIISGIVTGKEQIRLRSTLLLAISGERS